MTVLVNKLLGPSHNASVSLSNSISGHAQTLAGAFVGALMPAITNAYGANERARMIKLMHLTCKIGAVLLLPIVLPLCLEIDEVVKIWLKIPPKGVPLLTCCILVTVLLEKLTTGHWVAIAANGKIGMYQFIVGTCFASTLLIAGGLMMCGFDVSAVGFSLVTTMLIVVIIRIIAAKILLDITPRYWINKIFLPLILVSALTLFAGAVPKLFMPASFLRILITTAICEVVLLPMIWLVVLSNDERLYIVQQIKKRIPSYGA